MVKGARGFFIAALYALSLFCGKNANAFLGDLGTIVIRPYIGIGYSFSGAINSSHGGINYNNMLPGVFNSFGGHVGLRARYLMLEFSTYGAIPSDGNGNSAYGISSTKMDMVTMRFTAIATLHHEMFGDRNNLLLMIGMVHGFSNISYTPNNATAYPVGLQYSVFGTNAEFGVGYMRDLTDHFSVRVDFKYSPLSLSGVTDHLFTLTFGFFGFL